MTTTSVMSVRCRTSMTLTLTAFMSSSAALTMRRRVCGRAGLAGDFAALGARRGRVLVAISLRKWGGVSSTWTSIAPGLANDLANGIRDQETRVPARVDDLSQFCRRYFELRDRVHVDAAGQRAMQIVH